MTDEVKKCRYCGEEVLAVARKCRHCREYLDPTLKAASEKPSAFERLATPVGRPASAIVSGYAGLFAVIPIVGLPAAITAVACGVVALRKIKNDPSLVGRGRAWFGIIVGSLMSLVSLLLLLALIVDAASRGAYD